MHQGIAFCTAYASPAWPEDAQEAAQDAFVKAFRALARFRPGAPFRPWLLKIVANEARQPPPRGGEEGRARRAEPWRAPARRTRLRPPSLPSSPPSGGTS